MLPNQGNDTFMLHMYAADRLGQRTRLASRRFTGDNATATRPFGTIDTPAQGGTVSGTVINFGWALTPQPKAIPFDGSTVTVFIDGAPVGTVNYNHFRPDIATLFPGLANSNGAVGHRTLDTTLLANGVHTIAWAAVDDHGIVQGLGSRYFTVQNGAVEAAAAARLAAAPANHGSVRVRRGWDAQGALETPPVDPSGVPQVVLPALGRVELHLGGPVTGGGLRLGDAMMPLPVGSTLDGARGIFYWQPGPAFLGSYELVFLRRAAGGETQVPVRVTLISETTGPSRPEAFIDVPGTGVVVQPFLVAGWAIDQAAAFTSGVDTVHVWAYPVAGGAPIFLGAAAYGGYRPDVAATFGPAFGPSAYGRWVSGLSPGAYDVAVFPRSTVSRQFAPATIVRIVVQ